MIITELYATGCTHNNSDNNTTHICKVPKGRNFRGTGGSRLCVLVTGLTK